ncbi:helix-turn-helix domain-containing protein [Flagellimonas algicola]|uniref:AraC family transcriptional regulator n=1 Tax=Flagellimonas algicola TaxID=2583815 RepID=A0ABY2WPU6_9FLAO|nr:helix-turn-helix domain-containing protein [Allomuricauda algicola]TMU56559.1 AraC family transcriptional regulator [Allomuricauda algicola]
MQIAPSKHLSGVIKHYLFIDGVRGAKGLQQIRFFTDGNANLVFRLRETKLALDSIENQESPFIVGGIRTNKNFVVLGDFSVIIVVFQPTGLYQLTGIPSYELGQETIMGTSVLCSSITTLQAQLDSCYQPKQQVDLLNAYFLRYIQNGIHPMDNRFSAVIRSVLNARGQSKVGQLSRGYHYTERSLQRAFKKYLGIPPREYLRIVRFHNFLGFLNLDSDDSTLTTIGLTSGYYDQSHSIRDFKDFTSLTPNEYIAKTNRLATNLVSLT